MTTPAQATPDTRPGLLARLSSEALGSLLIVFVAAGVSIFSSPSGAPVPAALATGLAVAAAMVAFGHVSGGHFNPAITVGNFIAGRIRAVAALGYVVAQVVGSIVGAALVYVIVLTVPVLTDARGAFGSVAAAFGENAPAKTLMAGVLLVEVIGSALLVAVFLGSVAGRRAVPALAPFAVGLTLAVLLQFGQVLGNTPFNPARATAQAFFSPSWALDGLWLFWVAPLLGAALAGLAFRGLKGLSHVATGSDEPIAADGVNGGGVNDAFDADEDPTHAAVRQEATSASGTAKEPVPPAAAPQSDDARDFFDGKKG
ncbi:aquaporin [Paenarthrobacter ilicis]|uniref:MIP/aquaporin family protein n=1 Tax=Paenarthrobacter ilicis TaxID=43665 RepID=UPI0030088E61